MSNKLNLLQDEDIFFSCFVYIFITEFTFKIFTGTITGEHKLFPFQRPTGDYPFEKETGWKVNEN